MTDLKPSAFYQIYIRADSMSVTREQNSTRSGIVLKALNPQQTAERGYPVYLFCLSLSNEQVAELFPHSEADNGS